MSYSRFKANGYEAERRRPYGYESARFETRKPNEDRGHSRDYNNNFERDRGRDMEQSRRDSRDMRDPRESRGPPRSPHLNKKGAMDSPKTLHIDTKVVDGPRRSSSSTRSGIGAFSNAPTEPAADRTARSNTLPSSAIVSAIPKAKDPNVQDLFYIAYKLHKISEDRTFLRLRKDKLLREDQRRSAELSKIGSKVDDYAPYLEFKQRFEESGKAEREEISRQLTELDSQFAEEIENYVRGVSSHAPANPQAAAQTASLSKLETKVEELAQSSSSNQEKSDKAVTALKQDFTSMKSNFDALESDNAALKSENSELRQQVADQKSINEAMKQTQDDVKKLSEKCTSFETKIDDLKTKIDGNLEKVEDLDMDTYNEILEAWTDHDFKNKVLSYETSISTLSQNLHSFQESTMSRLDKCETRTQEIGANQATGDIKIFVEEKLNSLNKVTQQVVADSGDVCADMVDEVRHRIDDIQTTVNTLSLALPPSKDPDIAAQIGTLQQALGFQNQNMRHLENRIESIEGQRLDGRVDHVDLSLMELEKRIRDLQEHKGDGGTAHAEAFIEVIKPELDDAKKRFEALELTVRVLDSQWSNLSSKQMAERILQQLDPYGQRNEARVAGVEKEIGLLRSMVFNIEQKVLMVTKEKKLFDLAKVSPGDGKRHASSESPAEELMAKKRKIASNGQFAPQQYRSSSNNL